MDDTTHTLKASILIIDEEVRLLESLQQDLSHDFDIHLASNYKDAISVLDNEWIQVVLCAQEMSDKPGLEFLSDMSDEYPDIIRMIISGYSDPSDILGEIADGDIYQYIPKPWNSADLKLKLLNAVELFRVQRKTQQLAVELKLKPDSIDQAMIVKRQALKSRYQWDSGIIRSPESAMNDVCETIRNVAPYDVNILLSGESGTGKELCAQSLHYNSLRQNSPFVAENCGAMPDELLESELFGHKKGAFTSAIEDRIGLFEQADGGTILLDEISETSPAFQVKLLRVLQEGEIRPVGTNEPRPVDVRIIAATNQNLEELVLEGKFRQDLYYRLACISITVPPLRARKEDLPALSVEILNQMMERLGKRIKGISEEVLDCFANYDWPGNVRELQNEIKRMLVLCQSDYLESHLMSPHILRSTTDENKSELEFLAETEGSLKERMDLLESLIVKETLMRHRWNKTQAAKELGLSRVGLNNKIDRYQLQHNTDFEDIDSVA